MRTEWFALSDDRDNIRKKDLESLKKKYGKDCVVYKTISKALGINRPQVEYFGTSFQRLLVQIEQDGKNTPLSYSSGLEISAIILFIFLHACSNFVYSLSLPLVKVVI